MIILLAFDEGPGAGLGHRRRMEALAAELTARGHACPLAPLATTDVIIAGAAIVDSYRVRADDTERIRAEVVVAVDDLARDLAVDLVVDPSPGADGAAHHQRARRTLAGAAYALVPLAPPRVAEVPVDAPVERVLVTVGAADSSGVGARLAAAVLVAQPNAEVRLVVGPWSVADVPAGVVAVEAPDGLADELAAASIVVTAGGVTLLEACLLGRPTVALALAENQRQAVSGLALEGAVVAATPETLARIVGELARDTNRRLALAAAARVAIDGKGAARVVDAFEQVVR